jgi:hypothetical protein
VTAKQAAPYPLRMPPDLRERLELAAEQAGRSLHTEVLQRLEQSFGAVDETDANLLRVLPALLAYQLRHALDSLPKSAVKQDPELARAARLANAVVRNDGPELAESVAQALALNLDQSGQRGAKESGAAKAASAGQGRRHN